jgi:hypothetical protein
MGLNSKKVEATKVYIQKFAPHVPNPKDLTAEARLSGSVTLKNAGIEKKDYILIKALIEELFLSPEGEFFHLSQDTDNLQGFQQMVAELRRKWMFRYDEILNVLEYHHDGKWQMCNENNLKTYLQNNNVSYKDNALLAWLGSDEIEPYNALECYFNELEDWDGIDWIGKLCDYVTIEEPNENTNERQEFFTSMMKKHLVRMLRQSFDHIENRYVLVFQSDKQRLGKSHFFRWLNPLPDKYRHEMSGNVKIDKDAKLPLTTSFLCLIDEIEMDKKNISDLKNVISIDSFNIRRPYAKNHETIPRMASFFGTCNSKNYLHDDSNARFLSFSVKDIDHNYDNHDSDIEPEIPKDKLWAQVYHMYKQGDKGKLTIEEEDLQTDINLEFASDSLVVQFAMKNYRTIDPNRIRIDPWATSAYDFYAQFNEIHRGMTLSQVSKELRTMNSDNYPVVSDRFKKPGDEKKNTYFNLVLKG